MARTILGSIWGRGNRNELNRMLTELYDAVGFITEGTVTPEMIANGSITGSKIASGSIYGDKIANNSIEDGKLMEKTVGGRELKDGSIINTKYGTRSITWDKLDEGAVTGSRIADGAVNNSKIQDGAVYGNKILEGGIGTRHLLSDTVSNSKIQDEAVSGSKIAEGAVSESRIQEGAVTYSKIAPGAILNASIGERAVNGVKIANNSIENRHLSEKSIQPSNIVDSGVQELQLAGNSVSTIKVQDGAITSPKIMDSSITERTLNTYVNNRIYNTNYKVGVNIGNAYDNGNFLDMYINDLRIFISSGTTLFSITNQEFRLERNTTLYIDMAETTPTIVKGTSPPQSGTAFGTGGFFDDRKILLLSNAYGTLMGVLADSFKNAVDKTLNEKVLARKDGDNYLVYVQSKANPKRYTQYLIEHKDIPYVSGDKYSNVKVNTLNGAKAVTRNMDNTFTSGTDLVHGGAWDVAIRESNTSDGVGGIAHGDEIQNFFKIKTNGSLSEVPTTLTHYQSVEFVAGSELYRDSQTFADLQKLATHYKSFEFTGDGLIMDSNVKFLRDATLNYMYLGMCPINKQFTDKAYSDIDVVENDLTTTADIHAEKQNVNNISVYGATASVDVQVLERQTDLNENTRIEEVSYNKIYFDLADNNEVSTEGNVYRLKTKFEISLL